MKALSSLVLILVFSAGANAQRRAFRNQAPVYGVRPTIPLRTYGSTTGFGRVLFPGTGNQPPQTDPFNFPFSQPTTFIQRFGATISGVGYTGVGPGRKDGFRGRDGGSFPIAYPVFIGGGYYGDPSMYGYGDYPGYPPPQQPPVTIVMPPPQQQSPVIINQYPAGAQQEVAQPPAGQPDTQMYQAPSEPRPGPDPNQVNFFIALKDSSVYTALAYWVEDGTLHYITPEGRHNQVSLALVDRPTSAKLNEGRKVEFRLPAR
ncbi:MAG: hypothetical protein ACM336_12310 [Acidobacteriota bacterium]